MLREIHALSGGFGTIVGHLHAWASPEATLRSWTLFVDEVVAAFNGELARLHASAERARAHASAGIERIVARTLAQLAAGTGGAEGSR